MEDKAMGDETRGGAARGDEGVCRGWAPYHRKRTAVLRLSRSAAQPLVGAGRRR